MTFFSDGSRAQINLAVGEAMEAYANYEAAAASLIRVLLKTDYRQAMAIYFAVKSSRDRMELFEHLILLRLSEKNRPLFLPFWNSFTAYLQVMTKFRNALAHWHPYVSLYEAKNSDGDTLQYRVRPSLADPQSSADDLVLHSEDIPPFLKDCHYAQGIITLLYDHFAKRPRSLPEIFLKPINRQNQAVLRQPPNSKARQPQRPPSRPKLSAAQKRAKAAKEARAAKKT